MYVMSERKKPRATSGRATKKTPVKKAVVKTPAKKTTTKKTASKKVANKISTKKSQTVRKKDSVKTTSKKTPSKKTITTPKEKKTSSTKNTSTTVTIKNADSLTKRKKKATKALKKSLAPKKTKQTFSENVSIGTNHSMSTDQHRVTIFSRVKTDRAVILVARTFAFVFLLMGLVFSAMGLNRDTGGDVLSFLSALDPGQHPQAAQVCSGDCDLNMPSELHTAKKIVQPTVQYKIPNQVSGSDTALTFTVPADSLSVRLFNITTNRNVPLGAATSDDGVTWKYVWDTTKHLNGDYKIQVKFTNNEKVFNEYYQSVVTVDNAIIKIPSEKPENSLVDNHESSSSSETDISKTDITNEHNLTITLNTDIPAQIYTRKKLVLTTTNIVAVQPILKNLESNTRINITPAIQTELDTWSFVIDPTTIPTGTYQLLVQGETNLKSIFTKSFSGFAVTSEAATTTPSREDTNEDIALKNASTTPETISAKIQSKSILSVSNPSKLLGQVSILTYAGDAESTELYIQQKNSLTDIFIGKATKSGNIWKYVWDTAVTPNGEYTLFARHKNIYGLYESNKVSVRIGNIQPLPKAIATNSKYVEEINKLADSLQANEITDEVILPPSEKHTSSTTAKVASSTHVSKITKSIYKDSVDVLLRQYSLAIRAGDPGSIKKAHDELLSLKDEYSLEHTKTNIDEYTILASYIERSIVATERSEEIIQNRVGNAIKNDSDKDGISDYDEITLFKTDPFSADTNNDGFTDEAEILAGFDPLNDNQETAIIFESPKETGVVRDDILVVESIVSDIPPIESDIEQTSVTSAALISGKGLPNSFLRLYIFSTPIVVTIRTDDDGSWSYRFDKELEDGEHQVYVGITDNAGTIVAKSNPFTFVKEAQAFTQTEADGSAIAFITEDTTPTLFDSNTITIALASLVMSLGFVLLLISVFIGKREHQHITATTNDIYSSAI